MGEVILLFILVIPFILTGWNIVTFIQNLTNHKDKRFYKLIEIIAICIGGIFLPIYINLSEIMFVPWDQQLHNRQLHSMISPSSLTTIYTCIAIALFGYLVARLVPIYKQSPILSVFSISSLYIGIGICILWCIQTSKDFLLVLFPANCILIFVKTIYILVYQKNLQLQNKKESTKYKKIEKLLNSAVYLPLAALIFVIPLLGIMISFLSLFGQEPNSIIKAWTETADWNLSQKIAPQNIYYDEHYLCTVAAGGHKKVVKPLRMGIRHGHYVIVNRQLCIANAFEQILQEKMPAIHRIIRKIYDNLGYPISRHIHSKYIADIIYFIMKPLEWVFLFTIYTIDIHPENRIAIQYLPILNS